jgi:hypothetical protein
VDALATVTHWATAEREATEQRDAAIRAARVSGASLRAIAAAANLSPQAVSNICNR